MSRLPGALPYVPKPDLREKRRRKKAERDEEFRRAYGWKERVLWVQRQPCVFCGRTPCENAHGWKDGTGGTGMKGHYTTIVPACADRQEDGEIVRGCHWQMDHGIGKAAMERRHGVDIREEAARVEREWEAEF